MRSLIVNTYLLINLIGMALAVPITVASSSDTYKINGVGALAIISILDLIILLPFLWIVGTSKAVPRKAYLPLLIAYATPLLTMGLFPNSVDIGLSVGYFAIALYCMRERAKLTGNFLGMIPKDFIKTEDRLPKRFITILGIILATVFIGSVAGLYRTANWFGSESAPGVLSLKEDGIYAKVQTYSKGEQTVKVLSMMHYGNRSFFEKMFDYIPKENSIVLLEGIKDRAKFLGESSRHEESVFGVPSQFGIFNPRVKSERTFVNADIDILDFSPAVRANELKNAREGAVSRAAFATNDEKAKLTALEKQSEDERNAHLMVEFDKYAPNYKTVGLTWGI